MQEEQVKAILSTMVGDFEVKACECLRALFGSSPEIRSEWVVQDHLEGSFDYIFTISSENQSYTSSLVVGIALPHMNEVAGCMLDLDEAKDAFAEFGNNYCALVNDIPQFSGQFGILRQRPPQEAVHRAYFPPGPTISGVVHSGEGQLYLGYSIRENALAGLFDF